jgi:hypothetical protein
MYHHLLGTMNLPTFISEANEHEYFRPHLFIKLLGETLDLLPQTFLGVSSNQLE